MDAQYLMSRFCSENVLDVIFRMSLLFCSPRTPDVHPKVEEAARDS